MRVKLDPCQKMLDAPSPPQNPFNRLLWMHEKGSSVSLSGGDNGEPWECSWITSGKRCTGVSAYPEMAIERALQEAGLL